MRRLSKARAKRVLVKDVADSRSWTLTPGESPEAVRALWFPWAQRVNAKYGREMFFELETEMDFKQNRVVLTARVRPEVAIEREMA